MEICRLLCISPHAKLTMTLAIRGKSVKVIRAEVQDHRAIRLVCQHYNNGVRGMGLYKIFEDVEDILWEPHYVVSSPTKQAGTCKVSDPDLKTPDIHNGD